MLGSIASSYFRREDERLQFLEALLTGQLVALLSLLHLEKRCQRAVFPSCLLFHCIIAIA